MQPCHFIISYSVLIVGCFVFSKGLYKEISARVVLALISPMVFLIIGPLLTIFLKIPFNILLKISGLGFFLNQDFLENHYDGYLLILAAIVCIFALKVLSKKEIKNQVSETKETTPP